MRAGVLTEVTGMSDDVVAIHEASHAFAATSLGLKLKYVQVGNNPHYRIDTPRPDQRLAEVMTLCAGGEGEQLFFGCAIGGGTDDPKIERLLRGDAKTEAALRRQVRLFVAANYPAVRRIADALQRDGMLTGDEVAAIVRGRAFPRGHP
jgi:hypothetical protein